MPKTTLILVTILFGVICGNRLMDNRLLRSSSSLKSYTDFYKSIGDVDMNSLNEKLEEDLRLKSLEKSSKPFDLPCSSDLDFDHDVTARNCNENIVDLLKTTNNYMTYDSNDEELLHKRNILKPYQNVAQLDDILEVEPVVTKKNLRTTKTLQPKFNLFPIASYKDFYEDLIVETAKAEMPKRNGNSLVSALHSPPPRGCDCKIKNDLVDLGQHHFPRYLLHAVCHSEHSRNDLEPKCWSGSACRPLEYKVKVLTFRTIMDNMQRDPTLASLPDDLRQIWKFKTVTVTAGCFCS